MVRHASLQNPTARRALVALATAGVALGAGAATAAADTEPVVDVMRTRPTSLGNVDPQAGLQALTATVGYVTGPVAGLKPNPWPAPASTRSTTASAPSSPTSSR
ncbi:hypothetical protein QFZ76_006387 [Streptomyces sp. V4I2]|nr:hypothetical protein [Streptomyces sp. V4I2]